MLGVLWRSHFAVLLLSYLWWKSFFFPISIVLPRSLFLSCLVSLAPAFICLYTFCYCVNGKWVSVRNKTLFGFHLFPSSSSACLTRRMVCVSIWREWIFLCRAILLCDLIKISSNFWWNLSSKLLFPNFISTPRRYPAFAFLWFLLKRTLGGNEHKIKQHRQWHKIVK